MRTPFDDAWARLIRRVRCLGELKPSRQQGAETVSRTGETIRVPLGALGRRPDGTLTVADFPTLTYKALALGTVAEELAWFCRGDTSAERLAAEGCRIWLADAGRARERGFDYPPGELGPIYGKQWRDWGGSPGAPGVDQLAALAEGLAADPYSRRHVVSAWNVGDLPRMVLPPCHYAWQLLCRPAAGRSTLDCVVTMRSTDIGLGLPFNVASYALLTVLVACSAAARLGRPVEEVFTLGEIIVQMGDCHIYRSHLAPLEEATADRPDELGVGVTLALGPALQGVDEFSRGGRDRRAGIWENPPGWTPPPRVALELHV